MAELYVPEGFFVTTLSSDINASTATIPLTAVPSTVTKGYMVIEPNHATKREVIHFTSVGASTVTAADDTTDGTDATGRGCKGSITAGANTSHDQGVTVIIAATYNYWKRLMDKLNGSDATVLVDSNGNEILKTSSVASAVNELTIKNAATGNGPEVQATGGDTNIDLNLAPKGTGAVNIKATADSSSEIRVFEDTDNGTNYIGIKSPAAVTASKTFLLPDGDGSANQVLKTDGALQLGWASTPGSDGWTPFSGTLVYVSASSFKVEGADWTATFTKGTRIKLTQTSAKYFVVTSSSFSTDTTVNVTAGTDYTVANAAITSPYYSYDMSPQGYPTSFTYAPSPTNWTVGDGTWTRAIFSVVDRRVFVSLKFTFGSTSAMAGSMAVSTPITIGQSGASDIDVLGVASIRDAGSAMYDATVYYVSSSAVRLYARGAGSTYVGPVGLSSTVPMTWTTSDQFIAEFSYYL